MNKCPDRNMPKKYRKKPIIVEAKQFTIETKDQVFNWINCNRFADLIDGEPVLIIATLEGDMTTRLGDWVIKGIDGEFYPCKPDIFEKTYEAVEK